MPKQPPSPNTSADKLETAEQMAAYINAEIDKAPHDSAALLTALGVVVRARGISRVAREARLSREGVSKALAGDGNPKFTTVSKIVQAVGLRFHFKASILG